MRWTAVPIVLKPQLKVDGDRPARTRQYVRRTVRRSVCAVVNDESDDVPGAISASTYLVHEVSKPLTPQGTSRRLVRIFRRAART